MKKLLDDPSTDENTTLEFTLEDVQPEIFGYFHNWVYDTFKKVDAKHLNTVDFAKLYVFASNFKISFLIQDVLVYLFRCISLETESPIFGTDNHLVDFLRLAFSLGSQTTLARLAVDRMLKLAGTGRPVKEWYPSYPGEMRRQYDWKIHLMLEEGGVPRPFELQNYLISQDGARH